MLDKRLMDLALHLHPYWHLPVLEDVYLVWYAFGLEPEDPSYETAYDVVPVPWLQQ